MILIVKLDENMPPLMVEALKHNIFAAPGVQGVEWQEAAEHSVQADGAGTLPESGEYFVEYVESNIVRLTPRR